MDEVPVTVSEQDAVLAARLDGYVNFVYRAVKADREGRRLERRLDAAESLAWLLDVVFALSARVRPYNKYLAWELQEHLLAVPDGRRRCCCLSWRPCSTAVRPRCARCSPSWSVSAAASTSPVDGARWAAPSTPGEASWL